jgi:hypothetical protein
MRCEECAPDALEEFLDGELDARRVAETRAHLAACRVCAAAYERLLDEQMMYAGYERALDATPQALWPGVAARIAAEPRRTEQPPVRPSLLRRLRALLLAPALPALIAPRFSPALTAAMLLVAIGATAVVMRRLDSQPVAPRDLISVAPTPATPSHGVRPTPTATPADAPRNVAPADDVSERPHGREKNQQAAPPPRKRAAVREPGAPEAANATPLVAAGQNDESLRRQRATGRLVREAEAKYLAAIRMLSQDVNRRRTRLDPQIAARFDETLAAIDRSIAETRRTVLRQRNDPVAVQYMLSAYAKKVEVMREMAALD